MIQKKGFGDESTAGGAPVLSPIDLAREFVQAAVQRPALSNPNLDAAIKQKIKHSDVWLAQFKRVGDLYLYLKRFSREHEDHVYLAMKAQGLQTFEDITDSFNERFENWIDDTTKATSFVVGEPYAAHDILIFCRAYDTRAGGMFVISSHAEPEFVVIKATLSGGRYPNEWLEPSRRLKYYFKSITQGGVQNFGEHFQANAAILNNRQIPILTFVRQSEADRFTYHGVFTYRNHHTESGGAKWFELEVASTQPEGVYASSNYVSDAFARQIARSLSDSGANRRARLSVAPQKPRQIIIQSTVFVRNPDVVAEILVRARGTCESCGKVAPFLRRSSGEPYLEVHHRTPLAQGGDDTVENAIALCPNCHRQKHYG